MNRFPDGARVCYVGASMIRAGVFLEHIVAYYRENFPNSKVEFYNCGIAGGNLGNVMDIYDEDIDIYEPTHIVLMIGTNDSRRGLLKGPPSSEKYDKLYAAYELYKERMERFYSFTRERGIELILCTIPPYAEYQEEESTVYRGGYALILGYSEFIRSFAASYGLGLCDYHQALTRDMQSEKLFGTDRTHPTEYGQICMARAFLASQGIDYEPVERFPEDIAEWYDVTQKFRNIITTEFNAIPNYSKMTSDERAAYIDELSRKIEAGEYDPGDYLKRQIEKYKLNKPRQAEYTEYLINFMRNKKQ